MLHLPALAAADPYAGRARPVFVFGAAGDAAAARQLAALEPERQALADRAVALVAVSGNRVRTLLGPSPGTGAAALRQRFGVGKAAFRVVLVGKDGGVKLSSASPVPVDRLFALIDAMPMRQREMQR